MIDTLFYSILLPLAFLGLGILAMVAGFLLIKVTSFRGPRMVIAGGLLIALLAPITPLLDILYFETSLIDEAAELIWFALSCLETIGASLLVGGLFLICKEFRALITDYNIYREIQRQEAPPTSPES